MYFEDMSKYSYYLKSPVSKVKNVGWLDITQPYEKGEINSTFLLNLFHIILGNEFFSTEVNKNRDCDPCCICGLHMKEVVIKSDRIYLGASEIWIPSDNEGSFFASPSMIYHYIKDHKYLPPKEFVFAVINFDFEQKFNAQDIYLEKIQGHF